MTIKIPGRSPGSGWTGIHEPEELATFQNGETRLLYARDTRNPTGPLVYMPDGQAAAMRTLTRRHLECFMPGCADRRLTTVDRRYARDGFRHLRRTGNHASESLFHHQSKALICRWIRGRFPELTATMETSAAGGERRADVLVTWPDGHQLAIEIQYSALRPGEWRARHLSYVEKGLNALWLFGHAGFYMRPTWRGNNLTPAQRAEVNLQFDHRSALKAAVPVHWINPIEEKIGTASAWAAPSAWSYTWQNTVRYGDGFDNESFAVPLHGMSMTGHLHLDDLSQCQLTPNGINTPTDLHLAGGQQNILSIESSRRGIDERWREERQTLEAKAVAARAAQQSRTQDKPAKVFCRVCRLPIDPWIAHLGRHIGCR